MSWNIFDNQAMDAGPPMKRYRIEEEPATSDLQNVHRIPANDGFEHKVSRECPCLPSLGGGVTNEEGKFIFTFNHEFQGEAR